MDLNRYIDFKVMPSSGGATTLPGPIAASRLVSIIHGVMSDTGLKFALAFPFIEQKGSSFRSVRLFATDIESIEVLISELDKNSFVEKSIQIGFPRSVPSDFDGKWVSYRRYRIPSRSAGKPRFRIKRMKYLEDNLIWLQMVSSTNKNSFSIPILVEEANPSIDKGVPTSYGLSRADSRIALPVL